MSCFSRGDDSELLVNLQNLGGIHGQGFESGVGRQALLDDLAQVFAELFRLVHSLAAESENDPLLVQDARVPQFLLGQALHVLLDPGRQRLVSFSGRTSFIKRTARSPAQARSRLVGKIETKNDRDLLFLQPVHGFPGVPPTINNRLQMKFLGKVQGAMDLIFGVRLEDYRNLASLGDRRQDRPQGIEAWIERRPMAGTTLSLECRP